MSLHSTIAQPNLPPSALLRATPLSTAKEANTSDLDNFETLIMAPTKIVSMPSPSSQADAGSFILLDDKV